MSSNDSVSENAYDTDAMHDTRQDAEKPSKETKSKIIPKEDNNHITNLTNSKLKGDPTGPFGGVSTP